MRQRVGFPARLVVRPAALFMDEPFSALDMLTAENLRSEILELWLEHKFPARLILIVIHNIEEAVYLADRIIVLGSNPGIIRAEFKIELPHWRERKSQQFTELVDQIYQVMTNPEANVDELLAPYRQAVVAGTQGLVSVQAAETLPADAGVGEEERITASAQAFLAHTAEQAQGLRLPQAKVGGITGLLELVEEQGGEADLYRLAQQLNFEVDDLLPITDALDLLDLSEVAQGDIKLNEKGREFVNASMQARKELFRQQLLARVPLIDSIYRSLELKQNHELEADFFIDVLDQRFSSGEAERQLETAIDWGRYAELFEYEADNRRLYIPQPQTETF